MANAATLKTTVPHEQPFDHGAENASASFFFAMLTDPGRVRHANQDACAAAPDHAAFVVCDGVGGAAGGEVASQLAAETFLAALRSSSNDGVLHSGASRVSGKENPHARLHQAVTVANSVVFQRAQKNRNLRGMATTLVAALLEYPATSSGAPHLEEMSNRAGTHPDSTNNGQRTTNNPCPTLWLAHAGDSRAYRLRRPASEESYQITQLTSDHSLVEEQVAAGLLTRHDALRSPVRNVITRAVGAAPSVEPEIASHAIEPGDLYLLASDGLTRELTDPAIAHMLTAALTQEHTADSLEAAARTLIDAANQHGGRDNITVLLLACR